VLTIAVLLQKGGSGKTTLAVNLAAHLEGRRTLVVDMDRQASALDWSAARQDGSTLDRLAVVKADRAIALPRFKEIVRGYEYVFLDGPPRLGDVTQSAAVAADVAVLPIQPGPFDSWAVAETLESLDQADQVREQLGREGRDQVATLGTHVPADLGPRDRLETVPHTANTAQNSPSMLRAHSEHQAFGKYR
jgi:chromosome partitioning protein